MKREFSAGGIVFQKKGNQLYWLLAQHSQHKGWVFPKGLIGDTIKGENKEDTAVREVKEETGIEGEIIEELEKPATYWYVWKGEKRFKTTYYYLMKYVGGDTNKHDHEMSVVEWLPTDKVEEKLTYNSDKIAFKEALRLLGMRNQES